MSMRSTAPLFKVLTNAAFPLTIILSVIPSEDAHQSEYTAECDARRAFISGFTGSAGLAVVSEDCAALFTDGRYFLQASKQLDQNWTLMKQGLPDVPTWQEYLQNLPKGSKIGIDPTLITALDAKSLSESLEKNGSSLVPTDENLVDLVWGDARPPRPVNPLIVLEECYTGKSHKEKIETLREELAKEKHYGFVVSALDEIAWLFNLRGSDVKFNPVFFAYALITKHDIVLYIDETKLSKSVTDHLGPDVKFRPYNAIFDDLRKLAVALKKEEQRLLISTRTSYALAKAVGEVGFKFYGLKSIVTN
ncbi:11499_t:CDS:2, partial [Acaulospora colombiana]